VGGPPKGGEGGTYGGQIGIVFRLKFGRSDLGGGNRSKRGGKKGLEKKAPKTEKELLAKKLPQQCTISGKEGSDMGRCREKRGGKKKIWTSWKEEKGGRSPKVTLGGGKR